ncbi:MAG: phosphodiester glycosidase family protein [Bacilli bacterium]|nr:phosphodiester glycosidase family protein [Bacilli bacterium]
MKKNLIFKITIIIDFLLLIALFFIYGPINYYRDLWVTTAMSTQDHKYLANILYSKKTINKIMDNNYVEEITENTNADEINITDEEVTTYSSIYEKQVLSRNADDKYKIINISGTNSLGTAYQGYIVAIYDPSRVSLATTEYLGTFGQRLTTLVENNDAIIGINASGFDDPNESGNGGSPLGVVIKDGQIIWNKDNGKVISGFNYDNVLVITNESAEEAIASGMKDAMQFGPALIVNGTSATIRGNGGLGIHPRTVLAQRKDGIVLFMVVDGRQPGYSIGIDINEMIRVLENYGAYNAVNMDGGASSTLVVNGNLYNKPCARSEYGDRYLPNAWILK